MSPLTERYYQHWHTERLADALERFLAAHPDLTVVQLVEVLLVDQALQWQDAPCGGFHAEKSSWGQTFDKPF